VNQGRLIGCPQKKKKDRDEKISELKESKRKNEMEEELSTTM
jgi:hypothetical protein